MRPFLPILVLASTTAIAQAQPPEIGAPATNPPEAAPPRPVPPRPAQPAAQIELDLKSLFEILNTIKANGPDINQDSNQSVGPYIAESRAGYFGGSEWAAYFANIRGTARYSLDKVEIEKLENAEAHVKVSYTLSITDPIFQVAGQPPQLPKPKASAQTEELDLKREILPLGLSWVPNTERWRIVPPPLKGLTAYPPLSLVSIANMGGQRPGTLPLLRSGISISNLKQCALGVVQFSQDWDEKLLFENEFWTQAIGPYCKSQKIFLIPGTKTPYTFNDNLSDKDLAAIAEPARTVLFYEGENEKPLFHYDGKAAIAFMDGHVKLVTPEEMSQVIWRL